VSLRQRTAGGAPSLRRGILAAALALAASGALSSCAASNDAATLDVKPDLADTTVGNIKVQNAVVIVPEDDPTAPAAVSAAVINLGKRAQTLQSVTVQGSSAPFDLAGPGGKTGPITVPANGSVLLGGRGNASASLPGTAGPDTTALGGYRTVTFKLSTTGEVKIRATVVPADDYYAPFAATPQATPAASASPGASASGSASGKPSSSTGPSSSGAPSSSSSAKAGVKTSQSPVPGSSASSSSSG
jgi:hypothetical protein